MQTIEIGILGGPLPESVSGGKGLLERFERLRFFPEESESAGGIVKNVPVVGPKGDSGLELPDALLHLAKRGESAGQQDAGTYILRNEFQLLAKRGDHSSLYVLGF